MVEAEEEYTEQMEILVSCFLRPFKMAASSKKPPCSHEDVNSIFLNSETVLFLHQIFLKGLTSRMESWPTLVLGTFLIITSDTLGNSLKKMHTNFRWFFIYGSSFYRWFIRHVITNVVNLSRVREESSLQSSGVNWVQAIITLVCCIAH